MKKATRLVNGWQREHLSKQRGGKEIYRLNVEGIRKFISDSGLKQKNIAQKAGMSEVKFCMILQGQRKCEVGEYASICDALDVELEKFLETKNC